MSKNLSSVAAKEFANDCKLAYQNSSLLMGKVRTRSGVRGNSVQFQRAGKGLASVRPTRQVDVEIMNLGYSKPTATLKDYVAAEFTDIFDDTDVTFSERQVLAQTIGSALGRRSDQIILDALAAVASPTEAGTSGTAITAATAADAREKLLDAGVPMSDCCLVLPAQAYTELVGDTKVSSSDFGSGSATRTGQIPPLYGFDIILVEQRKDFEGFDTAGKVGWAFHKMAIGMATGDGPRTEVNYVPEKLSWLSTGILKAGAVAIDTGGIVKVHTA